MEEEQDRTADQRVLTGDCVVCDKKADVLEREATRVQVQDSCRQTTRSLELVKSRLLVLFCQGDFEVDSIDGLNLPDAFDDRPFGQGCLRNILVTAVVATAGCDEADLGVLVHDNASSPMLVFALSWRRRTTLLNSDETASPPEEI